MNGCFDNQLPAVVFDGAKTSRMLSCQAVTIGRDVRRVASLAWGGVRGTGGDWSGVTETSHLDFQNDLTVYYDPPAPIGWGH